MYVADTGETLMY